MTAGGSSFGGGCAGGGAALGGDAGRGGGPLPGDPRGCVRVPGLIGAAAPLAPGSCLPGGFPLPALPSPGDLEKRPIRRQENIPISTALRNRWRDGGDKKTECETRRVCVR